MHARLLQRDTLPRPLRPHPLFIFIFHIFFFSSPHTRVKLFEIFTHPLSLSSPLRQQDPDYPARELHFHTPQTRQGRTYAPVSGRKDGGEGGGEVRARQGKFARGHRF
jgi:hypothetical protein